MSDPYLGEIRMFSGNFAPQGWALCQGQMLNITDNDALFTLLGTTYGGDGTSTFRLPDLSGRAPMHHGQLVGSGTNYPLGSTGGAETVTLTSAHLAAHTHVPQATTEPSAQSPANGVWATVSNLPYVSTTSPVVAMNPGAIQPAGGSLPHANMQPSLTISYIIALQGVYPSFT